MIVAAEKGDLPMPEIDKMLGNGHGAGSVVNQYRQPGIGLYSVTCHDANIVGAYGIQGGEYLGIFRQRRRQYQSGQAGMFHHSGQLFTNTIGLGITGVDQQLIALVPTGGKNTVLHIDNVVGIGVVIDEAYDIRTGGSQVAGS
ncbi:MAG: hypothetical protein Sw2LagPseu_29640 [Shewanella algae]